MPSGVESRPESTPGRALLEAYVGAADADARQRAADRLDAYLRPIVRGVAQRYAFKKGWDTALADDATNDAMGRFFRAMVRGGVADVPVHAGRVGVLPGERAARRALPFALSRACRLDVGTFHGPFLPCGAARAASRPPP